ncbi:DNA dC-_dU-editing enzyme APOBEC-3Ca-like [Diceros bicornis minor]|uniref:DNA dC->dU-editing enzyme APOBEC-3Ca-like n=1 Tax=Diceros bicornis minor TaxID=77932 RepID=UPI0026F243B7|nr:DNA dC->dU-editing enzyme APOBEC-3Ca-like [Diceros bicornis minor]
MDRLDPRTFYFHFCNLEFANGRNRSYLCFQVEREENGSLVLIDTGVFVNQVYPETRRHAELCFLSWFHARLSRYKHYHVTWFISWSPCSDCAQEVAEFLKRHRNVNLSIFAARLYYFWRPEFKQGLRSLDSAGARVAIMSFRNFIHCWRNFVHHGETCFNPWRNIHKNYMVLVATLEDILW